MNIRLVLPSHIVFGFAQKPISDIGVARTQCPFKNYAHKSLVPVDAGDNTSAEMTNR